MKKTFKALLPIGLVLVGPHSLEASGKAILTFLGALNVSTTQESLCASGCKEFACRESNEVAALCALVCPESTIEDCWKGAGVTDFADPGVQGEQKTRARTFLLDRRKGRLMSRTCVAFRRQPQVFSGREDLMKELCAEPVAAQP